MIKIIDESHGAGENVSMFVKDLDNFSKSVGVKPADVLTNKDLYGAFLTAQDYAWDELDYDTWKRNELDTKQKELDVDNKYKPHYADNDSPEALATKAAIRDEIPNPVFTASGKAAVDILNKVVDDRETADKNRDELKPIFDDDQDAEDFLDDLEDLDDNF